MKKGFFLQGMPSFYAGAACRVTSSTPFLIECHRECGSTAGSAAVVWYVCTFPLAGSGSGIPEHQLSFFLINHDLLVFVYFSFQNHF
jgi:hypothetical protein